MKNRIGPVERLFPMPCPLVVGGTMEHADALAVAWINIMASTPPTIAMGLRESRNTLSLIRKTSTFTVNIAPASMAATVDYFGTVSGRSADKFAISGLTLAESATVPTPIIEECPYNLECRVVGEIDVGSYVVLIGEIVETHVEEDILLPDGQVDIERLDPLVYIAGSREYRRVGEKVADAFVAGREIKPSS